MYNVATLQRAAHSVIYTNIKNVRIELFHESLTTESCAGGSTHPWSKPTKSPLSGIKDKFLWADRYCIALLLSPSVSIHSQRAQRVCKSVFACTAFGQRWVIVFLFILQLRHTSFFFSFLRMIQLVTKHNIFG